MSSKLDNLITQMESHLECWKQFNHYLVQAQTKRFEPEDESQFLEIKSAITQELEIILAAIESGAPSREEVHSLLAACPSIRYLSELNDSALRAVENQWHKIFINWQSLLGQLKVAQRSKPQKPKSFFGKFFGGDE